ncbi:MAG: acetyl/propionyl/methylcrotonyl-CoA carboxylase subunit alpha [Betaproteobacteria bacterium]|nr:MAG: acetyl/propionyl/methylcrotonyl-CoA carboxylase subunit alpha [Betaproteobacteria bacterium]
MFDKILIANRGEIACRIARTARRMGIGSVAVYSDADATALHVAACDEAYRLGPAPPRESYLQANRIVAIAKRSSAHAIHPGYGFLSENADFAAAVEAAGLTFIGPPAAAIRAMGSKSESKRIVGKAGVPIVPGYHAARQDDALLAGEADRIGYPVLIKASAGGGGKGMRIVERREAFGAALSSARREAKSAFGDDSMLLEKYLTEPRHIEIQVFADTHGQCVHLFERDCSVQRRHQKVMEEAPAPGMTAERRAEMGAAAVAAAKAIAYVGAGTVEFIVDNRGAFHFMEMNTRLQVEHPVTEMITGLDLVEWQFRVAAGEPLPLAQDVLQIRGHAIEARIYAEDPGREFLPSIGRIMHLRMPNESAHVRIDSGVRAGDEISRHYDPMIAKLVTRGEDRTEALRRMRRSLAECQVVGVATNIAFLQRLVAHDAFASGQVDTGLIARHREELLPPARLPSAQALALAAIAEYLRMASANRVARAASGDHHSPWNALDTWWLNSSNHAIVLTFGAEGESYDVRLSTRDVGLAVHAAGQEFVAQATKTPHGIRVALDEHTVLANVVALGDERHVFYSGTAQRLTLIDRLAHADEEQAHAGHLTAPMSGTIVAVHVKLGEAVERGTPLLVLEAMKMEHTIAAPGPGKVSAIHFRTGDQVSEGADLIDVDDASAPSV